MNLWWRWVRRSYAPYFLPVGVGIALALRLTEPSQDFQYEWQWASAEGGVWLFFGGAVIAGASAWEAWLARRRGDALGSGMPSFHAGRFSVFAGAVTWWLALHVLIIAFHLSMAAWSGAIGTPAVLHVLAQLSAVAGYCALGVTVGWWIRSPLAAPALAAVILLAVPDPIPNVSLRGLTWFGSTTSLLGLRFDPMGLLLKIGFFAALVLLVVATPRRRLPGRVLTALGAVVAAAVAAVAVVPRADLVPVPVADHVCTTTAGVVICGPSETGRFHEGVRDNLAPFLSELRGLGVEPPARFRMHGPSGAPAPEPGVGWIPATATPRLLDGDLPPWALAQATTVPSSCGEPSGDTWAATMVLREAVYGWFLAERGISETEGMPLYSPDLIHELRSIPSAAQQEWFVETYTDLWECEETGLTLPEGVDHPAVSAGHG